MTEQTPTDAEILELWKSYNPLHGIQSFARAVLAKFGNQPAVAPWRSAVLDLIDDCPGLTMEQDQWLSRRVKELDFASTPQPTQAQAGAVPLTEDQIKEGFANRSRSAGLFIGGVRFAEVAHGITKEGGQL